MLATATVDCVKVIGLEIGAELAPESVAVNVVVPLPRALMFMRSWEISR